MSGKETPQSVIDSYKKRQRATPFLVWGVAVLLLAVGIIILVIWFTGPNAPSIALFASKTPTPTSTFTPTPVTPTSTFTMTPTVTETPTPSQTPTPSGPFEYTVQDGDTCFDLSITYNVDLLVLLAINGFAPNSCPIRPGDKILIPAPGQSLPTPTPLPTNLPRGTKIEYVVQNGDSLDLIASKFNTTVADIMLQNKLTDKNKINVGQILIIRVNLVTPTPTRPPTNTPTPGGPTPTVAAT